MGRTLSLGPTAVEDSFLLSAKSSGSAAAGPMRRRHGAHHDQIKHFHVLSGIALGTSPHFRLRLFSLRISQAPVYWEPPGGPAPGREPRKGCLTKRLFPSGNPQLPSVLGSAGWFRRQGASPGVFCRYSGRLWVTMGCLWVASPPPKCSYGSYPPKGHLLNGIVKQKHGDTIKTGVLLTLTDHVDVMNMDTSGATELRLESAKERRQEFSQGDNEGLYKILPLLTKASLQSCGIQVLSLRPADDEAHFDITGALTAKEASLHTKVSKSFLYDDNATTLMNQERHDILHRFFYMSAVTPAANPLHAVHAFQDQKFRSSPSAWPTVL
jgi:hypothetical protein